MRSRTWIGAAAIAGLTTVSAVSLAVAQERQPGHEGAAATQHQIEKGGGQAMGAGGMRKGERAQSAQAQSPGEERLRNERTGQEKMGQGQEKMGQEMKPGEEGKATQGNHARTEQMNGEKRAGQENKTNEQGAMNKNEKGAGQAEANRPGEEKGKAAERGGQENGKTAAEGKTNEHRAGEAQTGRNEMKNSSEGEGQTGRNETQNNMQGEQHARQTHVSPQNVHVVGSTHLSNDKAARVADTLLGSSSSENVNVTNINVGAALPGDVNVMPLPSTIVDIVPEFRGYDYVVANDEIVIVQPSTRHVVDIINTGGGQAMNEGAQAMASTYVAPCGNP